MWLKFTLAASLLTPVLHTVVLVSNNQNPVTAPIIELSQGRLAELHTLALLLFGAAHIALAIGLRGIDRGRLWPLAQGLLAASGLGLAYTAYFFIAAGERSAAGYDGNDPLWLVASLIGLAMGALQPGLSRLSRSLGLFSAVVLGIWLLLVPLALLVNEHWIGAYERIVGSVYVIWMAGVAAGLLANRPHQQTSKA